ncbi:A/G-specific adenine glycosylase [Heyndrickxia ginsengihumi]|uniref:Adenine DNA glycosylase n=1 Tax=Heyndrickxia ginsengihumi TaxID=363870 RepID=A0A0A6VCD8_9BACI|nr:A/G-specific adenine glycosylase [Heyndrickxia ginsengihumi]KHD85231.1 DNA glycosylase [Heyndrickxia ginsengihumi]MBE6184174.1 A/G-specific adenine glycosylase [Bacillus sp. (in: firmicutes)]MCM3024466.1 A/G-specific adenine glycosylase [Heyndrickxia ginsengihumi]NEY20189.1 A/G-specific adenine glycosylase [Heyndrickxia ginsengihumi]
MKNNEPFYIEDIDIQAFQHDLITWFEHEQRSLPWREDQDPYKIWVSEIMLQQTRVDTVIPYFQRFIEQFPTIDALAEADEDKVLKAWEGLGYYSRVRNLHTAVKEVKEKYGGIVPNTPSLISKLKGVGPYTAGAILSIAYGLPEPAVDGNVMRVLSRILSIWDDIAKPASRKIFEAAVRELISHENPSYFNQALMELGALICTPTSPSCLLCPVREHCKAFYAGTVEQLPVKTKNKKNKKIQLIAAVLTDHKGNVLIRKRPDKGLLANMWEFPQVEKSSLIPSRRVLNDYLLEEYGLEVSLDTEHFAEINHVFTHLTWDIEVYKGMINSEVGETEELKLVPIKDLKNFAFPVSHQNIWKSYIKIAKGL